MSSDDWDGSTVYCVVMNHEMQYSIWPVDRDRPAGWSDAGMEGSKADCLAYVATVWTDMRPRSLQLRTDQAGRPGIVAGEE